MKAHGLRIKKAVYGAGARREGAGIPEGPGPISGKEKRHILSAFRAFVSPFVSGAFVQFKRHS